MPVINELPQAGLLADPVAAADGARRMLRNIVIAESAPNDDEGEDGDIWIVCEREEE